MWRWITCLFCVGLFGYAALAGDSTEQEQAAAERARVAAAYARLHAATTQPMAVSGADLALAKSKRELAALRAENASLRKQVETLSAQVVELTQAATPEGTADLDTQAAIDAAIKEHRIVEGMTVEQAGKAIVVRFQKRSGGSSGDIWGANDAAGIEHTLEVQDGRVTGWHDYR